MVKTERVEKLLPDAMQQANVGRALDPQVSADWSTFFAKPDRALSCPSVR